MTPLKYLLNFFLNYYNVYTLPTFFCPIDFNKINQRLIFDYSAFTNQTQNLLIIKIAYLRYIHYNVHYIIVHYTYYEINTTFNYFQLEYVICIKKLPNFELDLKMSYIHHSLYNNYSYHIL